MFVLLLTRKTAPEKVIPVMYVQHDRKRRMEEVREIEMLARERILALTRDAGMPQRRG